MDEITKKMLCSYRKWKREIPLQEQELELMKQGDNGFGNDVILDYRTGFGRPQAVVGFDWPLYECRLKNLEEKKEKCAAVERWIEAIPDDQTRCIFRMYYLNGMTWERISMKTGYACSPDYPRLYIRDKYLKKAGIR